MLITLDKVNENVNEVPLGTLITSKPNEFKITFPNTLDHRPYRLQSVSKTCGCVGVVRAKDMDWKHSKQFFEGMDAEMYKDQYTFDIEFDIMKKREGDWITDINLHLVSEDTSKVITLRLIYTTKDE